MEINIIQRLKKWQNIKLKPNKTWVLIINLYNDHLFPMVNDINIGLGRGRIVACWLSSVIIDSLINVSYVGIYHLKL